MTVWRRVAFWISKATRAQAHARACAPTHVHFRTHPPAPTRTHTHTQANMQYLLLFHDKNGYVNAPQCYIIRTLPVLLYSKRTEI